MKGLILLGIVSCLEAGLGFGIGYLVSEKKHKNDILAGRTIQVWETAANEIKKIAKKYDKKSTKTES